MIPTVLGQIFFTVEQNVGQGFECKKFNLLGTNTHERSEANRNRQRRKLSCNATVTKNRGNPMETSEASVVHICSTKTQVGHTFYSQHESLYMYELSQGEKSINICKVIHFG